MKYIHNGNVILFWAGIFYNKEKYCPNAMGGMEVVMANKVGLFLAGGLVGAGIALLYAPHSGEQTRKLVVERANQVWGQAQDLGDMACERGQEFVDEAVTTGQILYAEAANMGKQVYADAAAYANKTANTVKPAFVEKNDELRQKIDAARERIAAQVAKNAEAAHKEIENVTEQNMPQEAEEQAPITYATAAPVASVASQVSVTPAQ